MTARDASEQTRTPRTIGGRSTAQHEPVGMSLHTPQNAGAQSGILEPAQASILARLSHGNRP
jgi:hypothetical protein